MLEQDKIHGVTIRTAMSSNVQRSFPRQFFFSVGQPGGSELTTTIRIDQVQVVCARRSAKLQCVANESRECWSCDRCCHSSVSRHLSSAGERPRATCFILVPTKNRDS